MHNFTTARKIKKLGAKRKRMEFLCTPFITFFLSPEKESLPCSGLPPFSTDGEESHQVNEDYSAKPIIIIFLHRRQMFQ